MKIHLLLEQKTDGVKILKVFKAEKRAIEYCYILEKNSKTPNNYQIVTLEAE